jgi:hypothetical protein
MNVRPLLPALSVFALLSACAYPKTIGEYRQMHQDHPDFPRAKRESFQIAQPLNQVAQHVKKKASECLNASFRFTERTNTSISSGITRYQPFANISAERAEIYVTQSGLTPSGKERGLIYYIFLLDLTPISKAKTKAELYYSWGEPSPRTAKAVRAWATGQDVGCPNLAAE